MHERDELIEKAEGGLWRTLSRYFLFALIVGGLSIYIGLLLFGTNSVEVLYERKVQQRTLERNIEFLKKENARLQKEYFELKELEVED